MKRPSPVLLITLMAALLGSDRILAGSCMSPGPVCFEYWKTEIVFVGTVEDVYSPEIPDGETWGPARIARFSIEQSFRGVKAKEIEIAVNIRRTGNEGLSTDDMSYSFEKGKRYLVYASRSPTDKWIWSSICSRTSPLEEAKEDLKYIRGLSKAKPGGTILGTVMRRGEWITDDLSGPMSGIRVFAEGPSGRVQSITNGQGEYRFNRLKLGTYKVSFLVPTNFESGDEEAYRSVPIAQDRGCVEANFRMTVDGRIGGRVTDDDGRGVPGVNIDIVASGVPEEDQHGKRWLAMTDAKGQYELKMIPPGKYLIGIDIADVWGVGYEKSYYPGVDTIEKAQIFAIAEGQRLTGYDFKVPRVTARRTISGVAMTGDSKPIGGVMIALQSSLDEGPRWDLAVTTDDKGRFSITEHDSYIVSLHSRCTAPDGTSTTWSPTVLEKRIGEISPFNIYVAAPGSVCTPRRDPNPTKQNEN